MKTIYRWSYILSALIALLSSPAIASDQLPKKAGVDSQQEPSGPGGRLAMPYEEFMIPSDRIGEIERSALTGSVDSAIKLANYYLKIRDRYSLEGIHWLEIAYENGSKEAMYTLGSNLIDFKDKSSQLRGLYWLKRAAKECNEPYRRYAKSMLKCIDHK
ncbi:hypothetical protein [Nitrospirillum amazonense]|uniref:hypothetical protein n=1 Tax=Nitrospirillum amazonense TaxID=28077 RepID=UPI0011A89458|nr:hypothetical protein [Nitrospirillum amazonense]